MTLNAESSADEVSEGINLSGKYAIVTGASGGLGAETARVLAHRGATTILASRDLARTTAMAAKIAAETGNSAVRAVQLDLADQNSVRSAARDILSGTERIDILVNNAGIMACPYSTTVQGLESQFGVNHIGHFLLTGLLLPALKRARAARVVVLSSGAHKMADVDLDDPNWQQRDYQEWQAYGAAKSANALFALEFNRRFAVMGITANAVHPGMILTDLGRHLNHELASAVLTPEISLKSIPQGAATSVWAATSPALEGKGGLYLEDCRIGQPCSPELPYSGYLPHIMDGEKARQLWQLSEQLVGQEFN